MSRKLAPLVRAAWSTGLWLGFLIGFLAGVGATAIKPWAGIALASVAAAIVVMLLWVLRHEPHRFVDRYEEEPVDG